jgi:hypothetical protein
MSPRLFAVLLALVVALGLPVSALADDHADAVMAAKGMGAAGPDAPGDLTDENGLTTLGDPAAGGVPAAVGHTTGVQVNDPALDNIQFFPNALPQPQRPFEFSIQSETSMAAFGDDVVVGFNNSADQPVMLTPQNTVAFTHRFLSGVGASHDGGQTLTESSLPPIPGSPFTFGDPAVTVDRSGNFYYSSLGADAAGHSLVFVGKSPDRGHSFQPGVTVAVDPGADKEWIASGPDPLHPERDNVYVTWTSFQFNAKGQTVSSQLRLARSTDGGQTWSASTLFAPVDNGVLSAFIQFSNPVVDRQTGRVYVPFLHFGDGAADFVKVLISDDGGLTFRFSTFNVSGAPEPTGFPNVTPGTLADCGVNGGFRLVLHTGPDLGGGRSNLPVFRQATRLVTQPSTVVVGGRVFIAINSSTSAVSGDPGSRSQIRLLFSPDGGGSWRGPFTVVPATDAQPQHVHPAVSVDRAGHNVTIGYYTQLASGQLRVDAATTEIDADVASGGVQAPRSATLSPAFDLIPSNNPLPVFGAHFTTNYDRTIRPCYNIGEYMTAARTGDDRTLFAWGDDRNQWTSPPASPAAGTHSQPDVFAARAHTEG